MQPARQAWIERHATARAAIEDTAALLRLHRVVERTDVLTPPTARIIVERLPLRQMRRVGLFAGSFNPLTYAHVAIAEAARRIASLDAVVWTLAAVTVDKERVQRASIPDRLAQMRAFVRTTEADALVVINRGLYVEEAAALRRHLGADAELFILVGFDKIVQIFDPRYYADRDGALRELFALAHVLVAPRDECGADALAELLARAENRAFAGFVQYIPVPPTHARDSSTEARELAAQSPLPLRVLRPLVPPEGLALAQTGAYVASSAACASERYALRERWLHALDVAGAASSGTPLPPLRRLVARAARPTAVGARLRTWLEDPVACPAPAEARRIIAI